MPYLFTVARRFSVTSTYISLLAYLTPAFLQGIGDEKGPTGGPYVEALPPPIAARFALAALSSLEKREGGRTMSRSALCDVVNGCPPESNVSSSNCAFGVKL